MKYLNSKIVFREVPEEISLAINITDCKHRCPDCHSKELWQNVGTKLDEEELKRLIDNSQGITCVCFMGGDDREVELVPLLRYIKWHTKLKTCLYSGDTKYPKLCYSLLDYFKIGPYDIEKGDLTFDTTNQRFYKKNENNEFEDITNLFTIKNQLKEDENQSESAE